MKFQITNVPIDRDGLRRELQDPARGALVLFEGWIRNHNEGREVVMLEYEVYRPLAVSEGERILAEAAQRFGIEEAACVHREGLLELGEVAVLAAAVAAHREQAFLACRYIIDEVKQRLPIWKKEHYADGQAHWVRCSHDAGHGAGRPH
jgi:adenylyltransferase/sulfurtransferase